jgi:hypothetical protein
MSILCVNEDPCGDYPVWRFEVGEFFPVGMEEITPPKEVWGWGWYFILHPAETPSPKTIKIISTNLYLCAL